MTIQYGAHELMELHEVLTDASNIINHFKLYKPHVQDPWLRSMIDKQANFIGQEYVTLVQALNEKGVAISVPTYHFPLSAEPLYGLRETQAERITVISQKLGDSEVASGILGMLKSSTVLKMTASLECADSNLRRMVQQSSVNCAEMAYEVWRYLNHHGYYQVPTLAYDTMTTMIHQYQPPFVQMGMANNIF